MHACLCECAVKCLLLILRLTPSTLRIDWPALQCSSRNCVNELHGLWLPGNVSASAMGKRQLHLLYMHNDVHMFLYIYMYYTRMCMHTHMYLYIMHMCTMIQAIMN